MKLAPRSIKPFVDFPSQWDPAAFQIVHFDIEPDDGWDVEEDGEPPAGDVVAEGDDLLSTWHTFATYNAGLLNCSVDGAAAKIQSGDDTGDAWTCQDDTALTFFRSLPEPTLVVAAFVCLHDGEVSFRRPGKVVRSMYPKWDFLFKVQMTQLDDTYWLLRR